ncbi:DUF977 family protein [Patescibacteria group bacterium]|nr:DUF977 family protein [Patescibacteria group bacterium]
MAYTIIIFLVGIALGGVLAWIITKKSCAQDCKPQKQYVSTLQSQKKTENKQKILNLLQTQTKITNNDAEKMLKVSNTTAERYLNQLEKEGKIKQIGKTGRYTYYKRV